MKIKAIHLLYCGKAGKIAPGDEDDSKRLTLSDDEVKSLAARGALEIISKRPPTSDKDAENTSKEG